MTKPSSVHATNNSSPGPAAATAAAAMDDDIYGLSVIHRKLEQLSELRQLERDAKLKMATLERECASPERDVDCGQYEDAEIVVDRHFIPLIPEADPEVATSSKVTWH